MRKLGIALLLAAVALPAAADLSQTVLQPGRIPAGARFGSAVAVNEKLIAVGAYLFSGSNGPRSGAVFLFDRAGKLLGSVQGRTGEQLGWSLAFAGDQLLVGAPFASRGVRCGAVYQFSASLGAGLTDQRSLDLPCERDAEMGAALAVDGEVWVVGARGAAARRGRVYVRSGSAGAFAGSAPEGLAAGDELGTSVAVDGTRVVAGAPYAGAGGGAVYVFAQNSWTRLPASAQRDDAFGYAVAAGQGHVLVGAPLADTAGADAGAVYAYNAESLRETMRWTGSSAGDQLGVALAWTGDRIVAGARRRDRGRGAVELLSLADPASRQVLSARPPQAGAELGFSVAAAEDAIVAGAFLEGGTGAAYLFAEETVAGLDVDLGALSEPLVTSESGTIVSFPVRLKSRPGAEVTVHLSIHPPGDEGRILGSDLIFTLENWDTPQTVRIQGLNDAECDGTRSYQVQAITSSEDASYRNLRRSIRFQNLDDETLCIAGEASFQERPDLTVEYHVTAAGGQARPDGPGPELLLQLPAGAHVVAASADRGSVSIDFAGDSVGWSGPIPAGNVKITVIAGLDQAGAEPLDVQVLALPDTARRTSECR